VSQIPVDIGVRAAKRLAARAEMERRQEEAAAAAKAKDAAARSAAAPPTRPPGAVDESEFESFTGTGAPVGAAGGAVRGRPDVSAVGPGPYGTYYGAGAGSAYGGAEYGDVGAAGAGEQLAAYTGAAETWYHSDPNWQQWHHDADGTGSGSGG
jgi:hypothetical protein